LAKRAGGEEARSIKPPSPELVWVTGEKITLEELSGKKPADILNTLHPPELRTALLCLLDDSEATPGVPDWAKRAASTGFKSLMPPDGRSDAYQTGWLMGMTSALMPLVQNIGEKVPSLGQLFAFLESFLKLLPVAYSQQGIAIAGEFFDGARDGQRKAAGFAAMPHNPKCLIVIAIARPMFEGLSMGEVHRRFQEWELISKSADSRQTRALLNSIGFPMGRPGRPKRKKPA
jgi:hypothetical protein